MNRANCSVERWKKCSSKWSR